MHSQCAGGNSGRFWGMRDERRQTVFTKGAVGLTAVRNRAIKHFYAYDVSKQILSGGASMRFREELDRSESV